MPWVLVVRDPARGNIRNAGDSGLFQKLCNNLLLNLGHYLVLFIQMRMGRDGAFDIVRPVRGYVELVTGCFCISGKYQKRLSENVQGRRWQCPGRLAYELAG